MQGILPEIERVDFPVEPVIPIVEAVRPFCRGDLPRLYARLRFCQAGMIYRPVRERSKDKILQLAEKQLKLPETMSFYYPCPPVIILL